MTAQIMVPFPLPGEVWRAVVGWEGRYEVSSLARIRSIPHMTCRGMRGGVIRKQFIGTTGYWTVKLGGGKEAKTYAVHVLVAAAFLGRRPPGQEVRHDDGNRLSSVAFNLKYGTRGDNMDDAVRHGTHYQSSKTHCDSGHEFTPENTYIASDGGRVCKACRRDRHRDWEERNAASGRICVEDDCEEPQVAKGLCKPHYGKQRYQEKMAYADQCSRPGCGKPPLTLGLCGSHYKQSRKPSPIFPT